jgi:hypothetical protein
MPPRRRPKRYWHLWHYGVKLEETKMLLGGSSLDDQYDTEVLGSRHPAFPGQRMWEGIVFNNMVCW